MENIQLLRNIAILEQRLRSIESSSGISSLPSQSVDLTEVNAKLATLEARPVVDLTEIFARLAALEARPVVDLGEVSARLGAVEARPVVDLGEVSARLGAVEARPELSQRLSALELAVTSLNST